MVDAVHSRCRQQQLQPALQRVRQAQIAVVEQDGHEEQSLPEQKRPFGRADDSHLQQPVRHRHDYLGKVESQRRRGIQLAVKMMHQNSNDDSSHRESGSMIGKLAGQAGLAVHFGVN